MSVMVHGSCFMSSNVGVGTRSSSVVVFAEPPQTGFLTDGRKKKCFLSEKSSVLCCCANRRQE